MDTGTGGWNKEEEGGVREGTQGGTAKTKAHKLKFLVPE